jgi:hypothetical protein
MHGMVGPTAIHEHWTDVLNRNIKARVSSLVKTPTKTTDCSVTATYCMAVSASACRSDDTMVLLGCKDSARWTCDLRSSIANGAEIAL